MVNDTLANVTRTAHDVGLAAWLGGAMFGKFALNPSVRVVSAPAERGKVVNAAWNGYNLINTLGLGAAAAGWAAARLTETRPERLSPRESTLSKAKDGLMAAALVSGIANGVQGARLAKQAPEGAVPVESGTKPTAETPATAARIQRSLEVLGNVNILTGIALTAVNATLAQTNYSRPPARRALLRRTDPESSGSLSPFTVLAGVSAVVDQIRRAV